MFDIDIKNMDKDVRWFLSTFPWIGMVITATLGYITARAIFYGSIKFLNSRGRYEPVFITYGERPVDYMIIMAVLVCVTLGAAAYFAFRLSLRAKIKAMGDDDAGE